MGRVVAHEMVLTSERTFKLFENIPIINDELYGTKTNLNHKNQDFKKSGLRIYMSKPKQRQKFYIAHLVSDDCILVNLKQKVINFTTFMSISGQLSNAAFTCAPI